MTAKSNSILAKRNEEIAICNAEIAGYDEEIEKLQELQAQISENKQREELEETPKEATKKM